MKPRVPAKVEQIIDKLILKLERIQLKSTYDNEVEKAVCSSLTPVSNPGLREALHSSVPYTCLNAHRCNRRR